MASVLLQFIRMRVREFIADHPAPSIPQSPEEHFQNPNTSESSFSILQWLCACVSVVVDIPLAEIIKLGQ